MFRDRTSMWNRAAIWRLALQLSYIRRCLSGLVDLVPFLSIGHAFHLLSRDRICAGAGLLVHSRAAVVRIAMLAVFAALSPIAVFPSPALPDAAMCARWRILRVRAVELFCRWSAYDEAPHAFAFPLALLARPLRGASVGGCVAAGRRGVLDQLAGADRPRFRHRRNHLGARRDSGVFDALGCVRWIGRRRLWHRGFLDDAGIFRFVEIVQPHCSAPHHARRAMDLRTHGSSSPSHWPRSALAIWRRVPSAVTRPRVDRALRAS